MSSPTGARTDRLEKLPAASPVVEWSYRLSLLGKGLLGLTQLIGGLGMAISPHGAVLTLVDWMTRNEIAQDPDDPLARTVIGWARALSPGTENFYALYLLGHGVLNLGVVVSLLLRLRGSYHLSMAVLFGFVIYQLSQLVRTGDPVLLALTAIDCLVIALVWIERQQTRIR